MLKSLFYHQTNMYSRLAYYGNNIAQTYLTFHEDHNWVGYADKCCKKCTITNTISMQCIICLINHETSNKWMFSSIFNTDVHYCVILNMCTHVVLEAENRQIRQFVLTFAIEWKHFWWNTCQKSTLLESSIG